MAKTPVTRKLKRIAIILLLLIVVFVGYVEIVNRNSKNMTYRQKVLKAVYPLLMWWKNLKGKNTTHFAKQGVQPPVSFYSLKGNLNSGQPSILQH